MILSFDGIMKSKYKCESDDIAEKCTAMTLDEKIKILDKLRGDMSATERRGRELNTFASYSGGHGFKFRPETGYPDSFFVVFRCPST
jgi:hypothetical protein